MRRSLIIALIASLACASAAQAAIQAHAATTKCSQTLDGRDGRLVNIRVAGMSCGEAMRVLRRLLSLDDDEPSPETDRLSAEFERKGYFTVLGYRIQPVRGSQDSVHGWKPGRNFYATFVEDSDAKEGPTGPPARFDELLRVIPINRQIDRRLRLISVELYRDGVIVRYAVKVRLPKGGTSLDRYFPKLSLTDDVTTRYGRPGGGSVFSSGGFAISFGEGPSDEVLIRNTGDFAPAVPANATRLAIAIPNRPWVEVPLTSVGP